MKTTKVLRMMNREATDIAEALGMMRAELQSERESHAETAGRLGDYVTILKATRAELKTERATLENMRAELAELRRESAEDLQSFRKVQAELGCALETLETLQPSEPAETSADDSSFAEDETTRVLPSLDCPTCGVPSVARVVS